MMSNPQITHSSHTYFKPITGILGLLDIGECDELLSGHSLITDLLSANQWPPLLDIGECDEQLSGHSLITYLLSANHWPPWPVGRWGMQWAVLWSSLDRGLWPLLHRKWSAPYSRDSSTPPMHPQASTEEPQSPRLIKRKNRRSYNLEDMHVECIFLDASPRLYKRVSPFIRLPLRHEIFENHTVKYQFSLNSNIT